MSKGERHIRKVQPSLSVHLTIDDSTHKTTNRISPISNIYNPRLGSTHTLLMFSRSKEKRNTNKRCTTEPEGEELLASSNKKNQDSLRFSNDQKTHLQFDKMKFKKIKSEFKKKMEGMSIRRENSKQFLLDLTPKRNTGFVHQFQDSQRTVLINKERRIKNLSYCIEPRPKTIFHRTQASTCVGDIPPLCFTDRSKRSSISRPKHKTDKQVSDMTNRITNILNPTNNYGYERRVSYLKTEPEPQPQPTNAIEAQFQQFLKSSQSRISTSRKKKQKAPTLQFAKIKPPKQKTIPIQNKKYQYSSFYVQQVNSRNSQIRANTSRDFNKTSQLTLNSYRSIKNMLSSTNTSMKNLKI